MEEDEFDMATIDNGVYQRFNAYCEANGYDRSKMVELVIKKFMDIKDGGVE